MTYIELYHKLLETYPTRQISVSRHISNWGGMKDFICFRVDDVFHYYNECMPLEEVINKINIDLLWWSKRDKSTMEVTVHTIEEKTHKILSKKNPTLMDILSLIKK